MAKKCYAVRKGFRTGIVYSWDECQSLVKGFAGAEYRGFNTDEEAEAYLRGESLGNDIKTGSSIVIDKPINYDTVNIYTDGSYKNGVVSFGVYIESLEKSFKFYGSVECPMYSSIANIAGELLGVLIGIQLACDMGFTKLNIIYDYAGVSSWYDGSWTARGDLQIKYVSLLNQFRLTKNLTYNFIKVKGHSGVEGNVYADSMAKRGLTFKRYVDLNKILRGILSVNDVPLYLGL